MWSEFLSIGKSSIWQCLIVFLQLGVPIWKLEKKVYFLHEIFLVWQVIDFLLLFLMEQVSNNYYV